MGTIQEDPNDPDGLILNGTVRVKIKQMATPLFQKGLAETIRDEAYRRLKESGYLAALAAEEPAREYNNTWISPINPSP